MSNIRFLVFRGSLQNEGNFWALESDKSIVIVGAGRDNPKIVRDILNLDYLKENKDKIKALLIVNSSPKNSGSIQEIYEDLELEVPVYGSKITKLSLETYYGCGKSVVENFVEVDDLNSDIGIGDFLVSFFSLDSYLLGNIGFSIYDSEQIFYYLEDFSFSSLSNNSLLFKPFFFQKFRKFLSLRRKKTYLIVGCQNLNWNNNGSLSLESKRFIIKDKEVFLLIYDFDILHIVESLEIAQDYNWTVNILDKKMFDFLCKMFEKSPLLKVIKFGNFKKNNNLTLLTVNNDDIDEKILFNFQKKDSALIVSCLFPMSGNSEKLARAIDFVHSQNSSLLDLGRSENISVGADFYDLKFILKNLNPNGLITLQNSYKHDKYLNYLKPLKPIIVPNNNYLNLTTKKITQIKSNKLFLSTENLLFFQREKLFKSGLLVIFLLASVNGNKLNILKLKIDSLSISTTIDLAKMKKKVMYWIETKITSDFLSNAPDHEVKQIIERKISALIKNYLSFENDVEIEDPLFLIFIKSRK
jgi:ribonuclease J